jgi:hypothetical protein
MDCTTPRVFLADPCIDAWDRLLTPLGSQSYDWVAAPGLQEAGSCAMVRALGPNANQYIFDIVLRSGPQLSNWHQWLPREGLDPFELF